MQVVIGNISLHTPVIWEAGLDEVSLAAKFTRKVEMNFIGHRTKKGLAEYWDHSLAVSDKLESYVRRLGHLVTCPYYFAICLVLVITDSSR